MKKKLTRERIGYWLDCTMSKGPIRMTLLLFGIMLTIVGIIGVVAYFVSDEGGFLYQIWMSLMHTLDAGTLAGDSTDNWLYLLCMSVSTLCGLFLTSVLIGIVTTSVESKLRDLSKGTSIVQEEGHTTIIGFDNNLFSLLSELIEANANHKDACIVILGEQPKDEMEDAIAARIPDTRTTRIICRSGKLNEMYSLKRCAVEYSRSVIINIYNDAETVKALLALAAYIKDKTLAYPDLPFIVSLQDKQYVEAAEIAGEGRARIVYAKDAIARIIANTCRQHGLSHVLTELFNFGGNELYFEDVPQMVGKTLQEALLSFSNAVPFGIYTGGKALLNPPMDTVIQAGDQLILLEQDDGAWKCHPEKLVQESGLCGMNRCMPDTNNNLLVIGSNDKLPIILTEYDEYVAPGTQVMVLDDDVLLSTLEGYKNITVTRCEEAVSKELLRKLLETYHNVLLLNDDSESAEVSDANTLLRLILLRDIADKTNQRYAITTEMRDADNRRLASQARVDDFVVGTNFICLLMAQISEDPRMISLVEELLDDRGSELYMKPAVNYVDAGREVDSYVLAESAALRGEIYLGYRLIRNGQAEMIINPSKEDKITFLEGDQIVVVAES